MHQQLTPKGFVTYLTPTRRACLLYQCGTFNRKDFLLFLTRACLLACVCWDQLAHTKPIFLGQDQSTEAQRAEMTFTECFLTGCIRQLVISILLYTVHNLLLNASKTRGKQLVVFNKNHYYYLHLISPAICCHLAWKSNFVFLFCAFSFDLSNSDSSAMAVQGR